MGRPVIALDHLKVSAGRLAIKALPNVISVGSFLGSWSLSAVNASRIVPATRGRVDRLLGHRDAWHHDLVLQADLPPGVLLGALGLERLPDFLVLREDGPHLYFGIARNEAPLIDQGRFIFWKVGKPVLLRRQFLLVLRETHLLLQRLELCLQSNGRCLIFIDHIFHNLSVRKFISSN